MSSASHASPPARIESVQNIPVVVMPGRLDTGSMPAFDAQMAPLLTEPHRRILLDMGAVTFISSLGLRSLLKLIKHAAASGGRAALFAVPAPILEVIEMTGFSSLVDLYPDRASALSSSAA
jgi:anti-anti-sigma factor